MSDTDRKRRNAQTLEHSAKRMRIETSTGHDANSVYDVDEEDSEEYLDEVHDYMSEDGHPITADTPLTPFSPSRKFPSDLKTIKCTYEGCTKTFNRPARLASHIRSHTKERPFICGYANCDKSYMEEKHLKQHIKGSHTQERQHSCCWEGCNKSFLTATRLRRHEDAHQGRDRFRCTAYPPCNETFRKHQTLQRHIRSEHLELTPFTCTNIDPITLIVCNAGFDSGGALRKHEDRVHGACRFWCDECDSSGSGSNLPLGFTTKFELNKHIRTQHANCLFCDVKFSSQRELQKHIETIHSHKTTTEWKSIPCVYPGCGKTFTKKSNLTVHIRTAHNGERFICGRSDIRKTADLSSWDGENACGKDFVSKVNLEDHVRTQHLGLPSLVNAKRIKKKTPKITQRNGLKQEEDAIDLLTGIGYAQDLERKIPCDAKDCAWRFKRDYDLQLHMRSKHGRDHFASNTTLEGAVNNLGDDRAQLDEMYEQVDLNWELQRRETEDVPFWLGAGDDEGANFEQDDSWPQEESEMRSLIDLDNAADLSFQQLVDPALEYA